MVSASVTLSHARGSPGAGRLHVQPSCLLECAGRLQLVLPWLQGDRLWVPPAATMVPVPDGAGLLSGPGPAGRRASISAPSVPCPTWASAAPALQEAPGGWAGGTGRRAAPRWAAAPDQGTPGAVSGSSSAVPKSVSTQPPNRTPLGSRGSSGPGTLSPALLSLEGVGGEKPREEGPRQSSVGGVVPQQAARPHPGTPRAAPDTHRKF